MKKKRFIIIPLTLALISYFIYWAFYDMNRLPKGEFLVQSTSPNKEYTIKAYVSKGNATNSDAVRAELIFNKNNKKTKTIYWNYRENEAKIVWLDDNIVKINDVKLEVPKEKFDFRNR